jgi:FkbM family methyltransferase
VVKTRVRLAASLSLLAAAAFAADARRDIVGSAKKLYSQHDEELVIRDFFQDQRDGFFLDVGCGHPIDASNSYFLEKHLRWTGIGVDALPEMADKWRRKRPKSRFFNFIVTDHAGTLDPFYRTEAWGISSVNKPATGPGGRPVSSKEIMVPTTTLTQLLERNGVERIDLLSMDIEGHEPKALAGFDILRFKPRLACVESKPANRPFLQEYFKKHGYEQLERYLKYDTVNYYYAPVGAGR